MRGRKERRRNRPSSSFIHVNESRVPQQPPPLPPYQPDMSAPSNNAPSTDPAKSATAAAPAEDESKKEVPQLGSLEEDDEFEEFAEQGQFLSLAVI